MDPENRHEPMKTGIESPPASKRWLDRKLLEFQRHYWDFLERTARRKIGDKADPADFANRVQLRFSESLRNNSEFREYVDSKGMGAVRHHNFWSNWIRWEATELLTKYYDTLPHIIEKMERVFLRLADNRKDGLLFPLVGESPSQFEAKLLKKLLRDEFVWEIPLSDGELVWRNGGASGQSTLRTTDKGDRRLENLIKHGLMEKFSALDKRAIWRYEEQVPVALRITHFGRDCVDNVGGGRNVAPFDEAHVPEHATEDCYISIEEKIDDDAFRQWLTPDRFEEVILFLESEGIITTMQCQIYLDRKLDRKSNRGLVEVALRHGTTKSTVQRFEKKIDGLFDNPEVQQIIVSRFRLADTAKSSSPPVQRTAGPRFNDRKK